MASCMLSDTEGFRRLTAAGPARTMETTGIPGNGAIAHGRVAEKRTKACGGKAMQYKGIRKVLEGKFITRYDVEYVTAEGHPKTYEIGRAHV